MWRKSSYSNPSGNCVEWWFAKSSHSTFNGDCTEVALRGGTVLVRDSKDPWPVLVFTPAAWAAFVEKIRHEEAGG